MTIALDQETGTEQLKIKAQKLRTQKQHRAWALGVLNAAVNESRHLPPYVTENERYHFFEGYDLYISTKKLEQ